MAEPFLGEIRPFSFNFAPRGWAQCNGQLLPIAQNQALFSILGAVYGGDGRTTFALPDLRGRVALNAGPTVALGTKAGEETHMLTINEMPMHTHQASGSTDIASTPLAVGNVWGTSSTTLPVYSNTANVTMSQAALGTSGGSQPHNNMQPYTAVNFCIALQGTFPPRS